MVFSGWTCVIKFYCMMEALEELEELFSSKNEITEEALRNKL